MKLKVIFCPICGRKYHKSLYDFEYIHCNFDGCGGVFDKETGKILALSMADYGPIPYKEAVERSDNTTKVEKCKHEFIIEDGNRLCRKCKIKPHEDGDYSYICGWEYCRCLQ